MDESVTNVGDGSALSTGKAFDLLAVRPCRYALYELYERESLSLAQLARRVAARTYDDPDDERVERLHVSLHHSHVPKLESAAIVVRENDIVELGERASDLEPFVRYAKALEEGQ